MTDCSISHIPMKDRYFKAYDYDAPTTRSKSDDDCDQRKKSLTTYLHTNKTCLITLGPEHPAVINNSTARVKKVNYEVSKNVNRFNNSFVGKSKRGAQEIRLGDVLAYIEMEDGTIYPVTCKTRSKLIEVNTSLVDNPTLCASKNETDRLHGYIAVLLPKLPHGINDIHKNMIERISDNG